MFSFARLFAPRYQAPAPQPEPLALSPDSKVISMSATEDFVDVALKKLSYAEVAALSRSVKISSCDGARVIEEADLGADVSEAQMAATLGNKGSAAAPSSSLKTKASAKANTVMDALEEHEHVLDTLYNDKSNRFPEKKHKKSVSLKKARRRS